VKATSKTLLLWNPISNHGHLNMYLELYATALLELDHKVYFMAELEEAFKVSLVTRLPNLISIEIAVPTQRSEKWSMKWLLSFVLNKFQWGIKFLRKNSAYVEFDELTNKLKAMKKAGLKPDLVVCMYLDMTHLGRKSRKILKKLQIPWVGLLFHPPVLENNNRFTRNSWFSDFSNRGAIFFTESRIESYKAVSRHNQSFEVFPDVTRKPNLPILLPGIDFRNFANGRYVVGLIGSLDGNKKLIKEFLAVSDDLRLKNYCFVMVGEIYESTLPTDTLNEIRSRKGVSDNLYLVDHYINSEEEFDSLFSQVDIIFACYKNFDSSANVLAKSAYFKKPVLVTAETFIGDLTQQHNLGIAIKNPDVDSIVKSILLLGETIERQDSNFGFDDYTSSVSTENLKNRLDHYLKNLWAL